MGVLDYRFKLNFNNEGSFGIIETTEPVKFDGASFILEQDKERYGRDIFYLNDKVDLFFYKGVYDLAENPLMLPNGTIVNNLTMGFDYFIQSLEIYGSESEVEFILINGETNFAMGVCDFENAETDEYSFFKCVLLQHTAKQLIKRRAEFVVDQFSDEDSDGNYIEPLSTVNVLLKAKPLIQESEWTNTYYWTQTAYQNANVDFRATLQNPIKNIIKFGIETTLSGSIDTRLLTFPFDVNFYNKMYNFGVVDALQDLNDLVINIKSLKISYFIETGSDFNDAWRPNQYSRPSIVLCILPIGLENYTQSDIYPNGFTYSYSFELDYEVEFIGNEPVGRFSGYSGNADRYDVTVANQNVFIPSVPRGYRLCLIFDTARGMTITEWLDGKVKISAKSTAIDTVIKGIRYIDVIKQTLKSISGFGVESEDIDVGGKFYDQVVFTGNLMKGRDDVQFPVTFKTIIETLQEVNQDYQILDDRVYIGSYENFYANNEIAVLPTYPDESYVRRFNDRFIINSFEYKYKEFEQDRDSTNTTDGVHTETQFTNLNRQGEGVKKIELEQIRDYNKIEVVRKESVKVTTSTNDDDNLFFVDIVPLAPSSRGGFTASMTHFINDEGFLQLLKDADLPSWAVLGFGVGATFILENTDNNGNYTVTEITDTIITLSPIGFTPTFTGVALTQVDYPLTNVQFTNRTDEGFAEITGIISPTRSSNLMYTIKRNINYWLNYLASTVLYVPDVFKNSYFRVNNFTTEGLATRLDSEAEILVERSNFEAVNPVLTANEYDVKLVVDFDTMVGILNALNTVNEDKSIGGFIRCFNPDLRVLKLYPKKIDYEPATETLTLTGEQKYEGKFLEISREGSNIIINNVPYNVVTTNYDWFEINNDFVIIFDTNKIPINNPIRFDFVKVEGILYDNSTDLAQAIIDL